MCVNCLCPRRGRLLIPSTDNARRRNRLYNSAPEITESLNAHWN